MFHQTSSNFFSWISILLCITPLLLPCWLRINMSIHTVSHRTFFGLKKLNLWYRPTLWNSAWNSQSQTRAAFVLPKFSDINAPDITKTWPTVSRLSFASFSTRENLDNTIWRCEKLVKKLYDNCFLIWNIIPQHPISPMLSDHTAKKICFCLNFWNPCKLESTPIKEKKGA